MKEKKRTYTGALGGFVATAHHADDQMETMMLKLIRGAHISHLQPVGNNHSK
jgi:tRNA(Ile)-lysidine synthase TilS/MesJ